MKLTPALVSLVLAASQASAINYYVFSNIVDCQGANYEFTDNGGECRNAYPAQWGYSVLYYDLPQGTEGQGYTDSGCNSYLFGVFGPGTQCWKSAGGSRAASVNWFHSPNGKRETNGTTECLPPTAFNYQVGGEDRRIAIKTTEDAQRIGELYIAGKFTELEKYSKCEYPPLRRVSQLLTRAAEGRLPGLDAVSNGCGYRDA